MWIGLACAFITVFSSFIYFTGRIVGKISQLSRQFKSVSDNGKFSSIEVKGNDEIAVLAANAEKMRRNIVMHYENEQRAYKSNAELMTAISHDIRTPLTSLLLYTDALSKGKVEEMEDIKKYASVCYEKSSQLKNMTDTMFRYFLLFTDNGNKPSLDSFDASQLLSQLVFEYEFALEQKGYSITVEPLSEECRILADISVLKRVFDNIFSNLEKYADKEKSISVSVTRDESYVRVSVINYIAPDSDSAESNRIGLRSCKKLMTSMGGDFEFGKKCNIFETLIILPSERT
jgi:signal transduction histidine kinase